MRPEKRQAQTNPAHDITRRRMLKGAAGLIAGAGVGGIASRTARAKSETHRRIRLGVLGAAHIHVDTYGKILEQYDGIDTVAVYDDTPALAESAREKMGGEIMSSPEALLARDDIEGVIILSENTKHASYAIAAAEAGKAMFVEKPLDFDGKRAARIAAAVNRAGVIFQTGYFMRSQGNIRFVRKAMREGAFGKVSRLRVQYAHGGSLLGWWDGDHSWMADMDQVGRGALGDLGIHCLDALLWMTEGDPLVEVAARVGNLTGSYGGIDEYGEAMIRFRSGLVATIAAGYVDHSDVNRLEISGLDGHGYIAKDRLFLRNPGITGESREIYWSRFDPSLSHPFEMFLEALRGENVPLISVDEAARGVAVMDSIYEAAGTGNWVKSTIPHAGGEGF